MRDPEVKTESDPSEMYRRRKVEPEKMGQLFIEYSGPKGLDKRVLPKSTLWRRADWFSTAEASCKEAHAQSQMKR